MYEFSTFGYNIPIRSDIMNPFKRLDQEQRKFSQRNHQINNQIDEDNGIFDEENLPVVGFWGQTFRQ